MSTTVDDLIISLTIKEGGKLDKLRKQLKAIVGEKGEKKFKVDLGTVGKTIGKDVVWIKDRIKFLLPTETPGKTRPYAMRETSAIIDTLIGKYTKAYAKKMKPLKLTDIATLMSEFGVETEEQLENALEDKLRDWQLYLEMIMKGLWVDDNAQKFMNRLRTLIHGKEMPKGERLTLMRKIQEAVGEGNKFLADLFTAKGIPTLAEVLVSRINKDLFGKVFRNAEQGLRDEASRWFDSFGIESEELKKYVEDMWGKGKATGPIDVIDKFAKEFGYKIDEIWKGLTPKKVREDEKLRALSLAIFRRMGIEKGKGGVGFPSAFEETIYEAFKKYQTPVFRGTPEELAERKKILVEGFEKKFGAKYTEKMFRRKRIDFLFTEIPEHLEEIKELLGTDVAYYLKDLGSSFAELKNILSESNIGQFRDYLELTGEHLVGIASMVKDSFTKLSNVETAQINIMSELKKAGAIQALSDMEKQEIREKAGEELSKEKKQADILKILGNKSDEIKGLVEEAIELAEEGKNIESTGEPMDY